MDLTGLRAFIVEDEALVLLTLEDMMADLGCEVVVSVQHVEEALRFALDMAVDFALLDVNVGGTRIDPVARVLAARGIPIVFVTGYEAVAPPGRSTPSGLPSRSRYTSSRRESGRPSGGRARRDGPARQDAARLVGRAPSGAVRDIIALPLLVLLGAMLYRSAVQEHQRLERLIGQELGELTAGIDRDIERRTAVLQTLATAPSLAAKDWPAFFLRPRRASGGTISCCSMRRAASS